MLDVLNVSDTLFTFAAMRLISILYERITFWLEECRQEFNDAAQFYLYGSKSQHYSPHSTYSDVQLAGISHSTD